MDELEGVGAPGADHGQYGNADPVGGDEEGEGGGGEEPRPRPARRGQRDHGRDEDREKEVISIYKGDPNAEQLLRDRGIRYIILGPQEKDWAAQYSVSLNEQFFSRFPTVATHGPYRLLSVQKKE